MRFPLLQGAYEARGIIANAQRCENLFPEPNPNDAPFPVTHYTTSGTRVWTDLSSIGGQVRGLYWSAGKGRYYAVVDTTFVELTAAGQYSVLGNLGANSGNPVKMMDNGLVLVLVDGSANGWVLDLQTYQFSSIAHPPGLTISVDMALDFNQNGVYNPSTHVFQGPGNGTVNWYATNAWAGMLVLLTAQTDTTQNGPYYVINPGDANSPFSMIRLAESFDANLMRYGLVVVDNRTNTNWQLITSGPIVIDTTPLTFSPLPFYGANHVDFIDTFFIFNWPGTPTFYVSPSNWNGRDPFDPNYWAEKIGFSDLLVAAICLHDTIWLLGQVTSEVWINSGAPDFPFQRQGAATIQYGCVAIYSPVIAGNALYWLAQDRYGRNVLMRGQGYDAQRVSNFAIENIWADYYAQGCIGMVYQQAGHEIVLLYFPEDNATWGYDTMTGQFHRRTFNATDAWLPYQIAYWGNRPLPGYAGFVTLAADRTGPRILQIDRHVYDDCGTAIKRVRAWPHLLNDQKRLSHTEFTASLMPTNLVPDAITLRWSDDGGQSWGNPVVQAAGGAGWPESYGQYSWGRLGYARDRVYELSWTAVGETALNGAWIEVEASET